MRKVFSRSRVWALVPLLLLSISGISPVHAATIANGDTKTGNVTGSGTASYTFSADAGSAYIVTLAETGDHTDGFIPKIDVAPPAGTDGTLASARSLYTRAQGANVSQGTWTLTVSRADGGDAGGSYALKLVEIPGASGTALTKGAATSGSNTRGDLGVYTFSGTAGATETVSLSPTGGDGFVPEALVYSPTGGLVDGCGGSDTCSKDIALNATGTYFVVVRKTDSNDVTGSYTLTVSDKN